jgi:hypothetical protein
MSRSKTAGQYVRVSKKYHIEFQVDATILHSTSKEWKVLFWGWRRERSETGSHCVAQAVVKSAASHNTSTGTGILGALHLFI